MACGGWINLFWQRAISTIAVVLVAFMSLYNISIQGYVIFIVLLISSIIIIWKNNDKYIRVMMVALFFRVFMRLVLFT